MRIFVFAIIFTSTFVGHASLQCQDFEKDNIEVIRSGGVLNLENWKSIDVILNFDPHECLKSTKQELIKVGNKEFWRFRSTDDDCDGGNTYGSIYSKDLKTAVAHIYDGDVYCDIERWRKAERAEYHKCDSPAEAFAQEKMAQSGFEFLPISSSLELREHYIYSFVRVRGIIKDLNNRLATIKVLVELNDCRFESAEIEYLPL